MSPYVKIFLLGLLSLNFLNVLPREGALMGKNYHFFAMLSRMKYINRWALMRNTYMENISEHSLEVATVAHSLAVIHNKRFGGNVNAERTAVLGVFHDAPEIITGDMPTPVKYFNPEIKNAYKEIETTAGNRLVSMLPDDFKDDMDKIIKMNGAGDDELKKFVKAVDKFSALIKCIEEIKMGNSEFSKAKEATEKSIHNMDMPENEVFEKEFLPSFYLSLDEQD